MRRGAALAIELVRNGSRGLFWLEPLVEVETPERPHRLWAGRGRRCRRAVRRRLAAKAARTRSRVGPIEEIPYLKKPAAPDLRAHRHHRPAFARRLRRARRLGRPARRARDCRRPRSVQQCSTPACAAAAARRSRPASSGAPCARADAAQKYVVCNADEGDSGTFSDRMMMEGDPFVLIEGMTIAGIATGATQRLHLRALRVPACDRDARSRRSPARARAGCARRQRAAARGSAFELDVREGAGSYVCGEETALLESLEGKRGIVRAKPPVPAIDRPVRQADGHQQRHHASPAVPIILARGAAFYKRLRHRPLARHAAVPACRQYQARRPGRARVRRDAARAALRLRRRQRDAAGRSRRCRSAARSAPICPSRSGTFRSTTRRTRQSARWSATAASSCTTTPPISPKLARYAMEFCAIESCGKCTPCRIGSTRGVEVIDRIPATPTDVPRDATGASAGHLAARPLRHDGSRPLCAMGGMTPYPVLSALDHFPEDFGLQASARVAA